jgi:photosystem II stability/assembly factor-like uncharacterized protein
MRYSAFILAVVVIGYSLSCLSHGHNQRPANPRPEESMVVLRPVPVVLNEEADPVVQGIETKIKGKAGRLFEFTHAQFVNENHGWAMSEYYFYRTTDGGKTWERLPQEPEKDATFSSFFFVDESRGWLTAVKRVSTGRFGLGNSSVIMVTDDGGKSWKIQASFLNEMDVREIRFLNANEGFAIGAQIIDSHPPYDELLVLKTANGGDQWTNVSGPAKAAIKNEYEFPSDSGKDIQWTPSSVLLLTRYSKVISTTDKGQTWSLVASFKYEGANGISTSPGFRKLELDPSSSARAVVASLGRGDYEGDFVVQEGEQWTGYDFTLTPIQDAVFLSDKDVLASGANLHPKDEKQHLRPKDAGVILRSLDGGKSWRSIYRSKAYETFFFLTKVTSNEFYAVSDIGTFLRFTLPR